MNGSETVEYQSQSNSRVGNTEVDRGLKRTMKWCSDRGEARIKIQVILKEPT